MIHVIIAQERRTAPRELAIAHAGQLHIIGASVADIDDPQIIYAASWDGVSPWITVLKGSIGDLRMMFAGWPMQEEPAQEPQPELPAAPETQDAPEPPPDPDPIAEPIWPSWTRSF